MTENELRIGTEVYYTGDMANVSGFGKVTAWTHGRFGSQVQITLEDGGGEDGEEARGFWVHPASFDPSPGRRFVLRSEYEANRAARMAAFVEKAKRDLGRA